MLSQSAFTKHQMALTSSALQGVLPLKRKQEDTLLFTPYAAYGVTTRKLLHSKGGNLTCMAFSKGWPSWFWAMRCRKLDIKWVVLGSGQWKSIINKVSPSTEVYLWGDIEVDTIPWREACMYVCMHVCKRKIYFKYSY
jgi:hypothetical protein